VAATVARMVQDAHTDNTSLIRYSDENSMSCVLSIAFFYAHGDYIFHRERLRVGEQSSGMYQSGTGFADLVLMPRKNTTTPAIIVELKYNDTTDTGIDQIHRRNYTKKVAEYTGDILLVADRPAGARPHLQHRVRRLTRRSDIRDAIHEHRGSDPLCALTFASDYR
jgi:hypothetical protein